ncbi:MAG: tRNA lysidine(34) synthetase TilS [Anaerolineae bacterium]
MPDQPSANDTVVLGVSGGPDSLALLHMLANDPQAPTPFVVHVNHGLRGAAAIADAAFVAATCAQWDIRYHVESADVPGLVEQYGYTVEEAARRARYSVMGRVATRIKTRWVCVAHTADDQAETVLMRVIRGTGLQGLRGMRHTAPLSDRHTLPGVDPGELLIWRPLLDTWREAVEAYCAEHDLSPRFDQSNTDPTYTRNRIRHVVLPLLRTINPRVSHSLARLAAAAADDWEVLTAEVETALQQTVTQAGETRVIAKTVWAIYPAAVQRGVLLRASTQSQKSQREVGYDHLEEARIFALTGETGSQIDLPGSVTLHLDYDRIVLAAGEEVDTILQGAWLKAGEELGLSIPGEVVLPGSEWRLITRVYTGTRSGAPWEALLAERWTAALNGTVLGEALMVRTRRRGERFQPQGLDGTQKLSTFMSNARIPQRFRDRIPLLVSKDEVVWVCGYRIDERYTIKPDTARIVLVRLLPPENT